MSEKILVDVVVLFNGNFIPFQLEAAEVSEFKKEIELAINESKWFTWKNYGRINGATVDGYYFKGHEETISEKMLKEIKKFSKIDGDEWKSQ